VKAVLQRVACGSVRIYQSPNDPENTPVERRIGIGLAVLLGVAMGDTIVEADRMIDKMIGLRVFADPDAKMNLNITQVGGAFLVVSQFTLLADTRKGRRPSFTSAANPTTGKSLYLYVVRRLAELGFEVATGEFGAHMEVDIVNDGPVTILLDTNDM
jgi:D-tyrosyl-tRNA(Tyr) deacylase